MHENGRWALIGSEREGLSLFVPSRDARGCASAAVQVTVGLIQPGLEARSVVVLSPEYGPTIGDLGDFFASMARDWRGWKGERRFESVDHDLNITATHDGHVRLDVEITDGRVRGWSVTSSLVIDPGESLAAAALAVARLAP